MKFGNDEVLKASRDLRGSDFTSLFQTIKERWKNEFLYTEVLLLVFMVLKGASPPFTSFLFRDGSVFQGSHLSIATTIRFLYCWAFYQ